MQTVHCSVNDTQRVIHLRNAHHRAVCHHQQQARWSWCGTLRSTRRQHTRQGARHRIQHASHIAAQQRRQLVGALGAGGEGCQGDGAEQEAMACARQQALLQRRRAGQARNVARGAREEQPLAACWQAARHAGTASSGSAHCIAAHPPRCSVLLRQVCHHARGTEVLLPRHILTDVRLRQARPHVVQALWAGILQQQEVERADVAAQQRLRLAVQHQHASRWPGGCSSRTATTTTATVPATVPTVSTRASARVPCAVRNCTGIRCRANMERFTEDGQRRARRLRVAQRAPQQRRQGVHGAQAVERALAQRLHKVRAAGHDVVQNVGQLLRGGVRLALAQPLLQRIARRQRVLLKPVQERQLHCRQPRRRHQHHHLGVRVHNARPAEGADTNVGVELARGASFAAALPTLAALTAAATAAALLHRHRRVVLVKQVVEGGVDVGAVHQHHRLAALHRRLHARRQLAAPQVVGILRKVGAVHHLGARGVQHAQIKHERQRGVVVGVVNDHGVPEGGVIRLLTFCQLVRHGEAQRRHHRVWHGYRLRASAGRRWLCKLCRRQEAQRQLAKLCLADAVEVALQAGNEDGLRQRKAVALNQPLCAVHRRAGGAARAIHAPAQVPQ